jgi:hypothetical protein
VRLGFDIEAWRVPSVGSHEPAFDVVLEADTGSGFQRLVDLGTVTTGALNPPPTGVLVNGNDPAYRKSYDSGPLDLDIPMNATLRVRWISQAESRFTIFGLDNVWLRTAAVGDANVDGLFDSSDLVAVFTVGEYEDAIEDNSSWSDGDWNNDLDFDSGDLVSAFQAGTYEPPPAAVASVPEPTGMVLLTYAIACLVGGRRSIPSTLSR